MLGTIREKTQGIFAVIIVGLLIIPFALWGINSYFEGDRNPAVATVDGVEIEKDTFEATYQSQVNRLRGRVDPKYLGSGILREQVLSTMVNELVLTQHAADAGYTISNGQLNNLIQGQPQFQNAGKFDAERFKAILRANGMNEDVYKREMRYVKVQDQALSGYKFSAIVPKSEIDSVLALREQQRKVSYLELQPSYLRNQVKVTDQEVQDYYNGNKLRFQTPDLVQVEYLVLSMDDLIKRQTVNEKELKEEYERNTAQYTAPAERRASHILVELPSDADAEEEKAAKATIAEIESALKQGKSFAELAKKYSQDPLTAKKGGDLGKIEKGTLPSRDLEAALVKLKAGEVSTAIRSQYGLHILKLTALKPATTKSFASVRKELERSLRVRRGEAAFDDLRERFETLVYEQPDSLQPAANDTGLKIQTSGWLTRSSGGQGVLGNRDVLSAAFSLQVRQQKQNSDLIEAGRNVLVAVRLKGDRPAQDKPLAQVRAQIQAILMNEKSRVAAREVGEKMLQQARDGKSLSGLAAGKAGAKYNSPAWIKRADLEDGKLEFNQSIAKAAFNAGKVEAGKTLHGGLEIAGGAYAIYQVHEVKVGDPAKAPEADREKIKQLLTDRRGSGYYRDQVAKLRKEAQVEIRNDLIKPQQ